MTRQRRRPRPPRRRARRSDAEAALLQVARDLARLARDSARRDVLGEALTLLAGATRRPAASAAAAPGADDALALAWSREQARLALADVLDRAGTRRDVARETLTWLVVAAAEALAHEPVEAVPDRLRALRDFLAPPR